MLISDAYRDLNAELHQRDPMYGMSGGKWADTVYSLARKVAAETVLDYGSGKGTLFPMIRGQFSFQPTPLPAIPLPFQCFEYDPAIPGKDHKPDRADLVVCGDVLEHIEPNCLYEVLDDLRDLARKAVFLVVATRPAKKALADGRNAHLIVEPSEWWLPEIMDRWRLDSFKDYGGGFVCVGRSM